MSVYRDDVPGVVTRAAGEPCEHPHVTRYTDAGGLFQRCQVCGATSSNSNPLRDAERPTEPEAVRAMFHQLGFWPTKADPFHTKGSS